MKSASRHVSRMTRLSLALTPVAISVKIVLKVLAGKAAIAGYRMQTSLIQSHVSPKQFKQADLQEPYISVAANICTINGTISAVAIAAKRGICSTGDRSARSNKSLIATMHLVASISCHILCNFAGNQGQKCLN